LPLSDFDVKEISGNVFNVRANLGISVSELHKETLEGLPNEAEVRTLRTWSGGTTILFKDKDRCDLLLTAVKYSFEECKANFLERYGYEKAFIRVHGPDLFKNDDTISENRGLLKIPFCLNTSRTLKTNCLNSEKSTASCAHSLPLLHST
jgi:hypothetical protein